VLRLLGTPLETFKNVITVLQLVHYPRLLAVLAHPNRKKVALDLSHSALDYNTVFTSAEQVSAFLDLIQPLVREDAATPSSSASSSSSATSASSHPHSDSADQEDFEEEQNAVGSLVHLFDTSNAENLFAMYYTARNQFGLGGPRRIKHTLPPLVFRALRLTGKMKSAGEAAQDETWGSRAQKVFKFIHETVKALAKTNFSEMSLKMFLQAALAASKCGAAFETIAYEFITQAFLIYEEHVADSTAQYNSILNIIGTLHTLTVFSDENYDTLITKTALYASKLLRKPDQCRAIYSCSHLFWRVGRTPEYRNGKRVLECLQRALKIADTCMDSSMNVHLFVEILNEYLYYFENNCDAVMIQYLSGLIALINTNMANMDSAEPEHAKIQLHYQNTLNFIRSKKESDAKYAEIEV
jgi:vacuolar protein sorting-associated protein 35